MSALLRGRSVAVRPVESSGTPSPLDPARRDAGTIAAPAPKGGPGASGGSSTSPLDDVLFFIVVGTFATVLGYRFGTGVQLEQFPLILKLLDPGFLQEDFFTVGATQFGPRFYYAHALAWLASWIPLPAVILGLTFLVNVTLVAITCLAARSLLGADRLASYISSVLVVSVGSFPLGLVTDIRFQTFQPGSLAIPGALGSLWAGLKERPLLAAVLAGAASLMQPLYGVETGTIALGACASAALLRTPAGNGDRRRALLRTAGGAAVLGAATVVFWGLPLAGVGGERLSDEELIRTVAYFRSPHHYIPSLFPLRHYVSFGVFLAAASLAWQMWRKLNRPNQGVVFAVPTILVLLACFAGYLFVEVWPSRTGMTAQPFRLLYIVKWQGLLVLGWLISRVLQASRAARLCGLSMLAATGAAHPAVCFAGAAALWAQPPHAVDRRMISPRLTAAATAVLVVLLTPVLGNLAELVLVALGAGAAWLLCARPSPWPNRGLALAMCAAVALVAFGNRTWGWSEWEPIRPALSWTDHDDPGADAARWARQHTPSDAVFVTPPGLARFRLIAERAIVADFWAIPYVEPVMAEWRQRLAASYGEVQTLGFAALEEMDQRYRRITDRQLAGIAHRYSADYALIYAGTPTTHRVLYANGVYEIIALD